MQTQLILLTNFMHAWRQNGHFNAPHTEKDQLDDQTDLLKLGETLPAP